MMQVPPTRWIVVGSAVVVLVASVMVWYHHRTSTAPKIPPRTQRSIDSLSITKPTFDSTQAAGRLIVVHDTVVSVQYRTKIERVVAAAAASGALADSLTRMASLARTATDSATAYHVALDARTREADSLRSGMAYSDSAWQAERSALAGMTTLYAQDTLRRKATERVNAELVTAIGKLQQPCKLFWKVSCPSRTVIAIGSAALAAGITYKLKP